MPSNVVNGKQQLRQHIEKLVKDFEISVSWIRKPIDSRAFREIDGGADEIEIAPVRSYISYIVALHEIGHIKGRYQKSRRSEIREKWAWQWARENALVWTPQMQGYATMALNQPRTYLEAYQRRRKAAKSLRG
jgi:hypothetical protein